MKIQSIVMLAFLSPFVALIAQGESMEARKDSGEFYLERETVRPLAPASGSSAKGLVSSFSLQTIDEGSEVALKLSSRLGKGSSCGLLSSGSCISSNYLSLTLSAPTSDSSDLSEIATLDSFTDSFSAELQWTNVTHFLKLSSDDVDARDLLGNDVYNACRLQGNSEDECDEVLINQAPDNNNYDYTREEVEKYAPHLVPRFDHISIFARKPSIIYGVGATVGFDEFDVRSMVNFNEKTQLDKVPWGTEAFAGLAFPESSSTLTVGLEYQEDFEAAPAQTLCESSDNETDHVECFTGSFEKPIKMNKGLIFADYRQYFKLQDNDNIFFNKVGLQVRTTYDFVNDEFGVDAPIYLFADQDNNLSGGIRLGYRTDTDDITVGIFLGAAFEIFGATL